MNRKLIIGSILVIITVALVAIGAIRAADSPGSGAVSVQAAAVMTGDISSWIYADGVIEEVEKSEVFLTHR